MNNQDYIKREAALAVAHTGALYNTALHIDATDANAVKRLAEEVIATIEDNTGEQFINFSEAVRLAVPAVAIEANRLQGEAK